jgi:putative membrane protein
LIFFAILSSVYTLAYELLGIKWLQVPLAPVGLIGTAVAFMVGF